ncbi:hypothetical protein B5E64_11585 [Drancourtella sp. An12]|uniref:KOW domain-containing RNA-binding protein n=1 Tax=Clostridia TaxID=186801 RepID=UPI000B3A5D6C|nr:MULTISPECIES: KOW domain-containing RNA-binding protein [Clostridia]OUN68078.1 hypothetical protein B5G11_14150 [Drancourtella sp. An57]OUQ44936.1 hypothetical protein B5E64_11585 [Drancourtella sp. An12]
MLSYEPGMLVRSLAGHDKGKLYIIIEERDQMLLLSDGEIRTMARPKAKKVMHVQLIKEKLEEKEMTDISIRSFIKKYQKEHM